MRYFVILVLCAHPACVLAETTNGIGFNGIGFNGIGFNDLNLNGENTDEFVMPRPNEENANDQETEDSETFKIIQKLAQSSLLSLNAEIKSHTVLD